ncbi:MAG: DUF86 domain-containing protein [Cellulosilyticum sp.]|nr:DUF86 domain-containing protein [Cellulosilyticum sp.]
MSERVGDIKEFMSIIEKGNDGLGAKFILYGLKQIFMDFFITVEDFTSIMLKELKKYKIGMDMKQGLEILKVQHILDEEMFVFLNKSRLMRNRIAHRYKEPSKEELLTFIEKYRMDFEKVLEIIKQYAVIE